MGWSNEVYVLHIFQLMLYCNAFINNLNLFMSSSLMCVFHADYCSMITVMCRVIFFHCVTVLSLFLVVAHK